MTCKQKIISQQRVKDFISRSLRDSLVIFTWLYEWAFSFSKIKPHQCCRTAQYNTLHHRTHHVYYTPMLITLCVVWPNITKCGKLGWTGLLTMKEKQETDRLKINGGECIGLKKLCVLYLLSVLKNTSIKKSLSNPIYIDLMYRYPYLIILYFKCSNCLIFR